jgi:hypothetical protein
MLPDFAFVCPFSCDYINIGLWAVELLKVDLLLLVFVCLLAMFGTSQRLAFIPLTNTVLLLGAPILPKWWVKISTYLQSLRFIFIIFYNFMALNITLLSWKLSVSVFPLGTYVITTRSVAPSATARQQDVYLLPMQSVNL